MRWSDGASIALAQRLRRLSHALVCDGAAGDALALRVIDELPSRPTLRQAYRVLIRHCRAQDVRQRLGSPPSRDVVGAFAMLPLANREALALVCIDDLPYQEAADIVDMSLERFLLLLTQSRELLAGRLEAQRPVVLRLVK